MNAGPVHDLNGAPRYLRRKSSGGPTLVYSWNPKSRLATRLPDLTGVAYDGLDPAAKEAPFTVRRQPRAKDKPVIRG